MASPPAPSSETAQSAHTRLSATFSTHATHALPFRRALLRAIRSKLTTALPAHLTALHADLAKPAQEALLYDLTPVFVDISYLLTHLQRLTRERCASRSLAAPVYVRPQPRGVVLVIGAYNFPTLLTLRPAIAALAAGNCVVIKPSERTPASEAFHDLLKDVDPSVLAVVKGGRQTVEELLSLKWDHIVFTGSSRVGRVVMAAAAKHLTPVTLELGGKCPAVITASAELSTAAASVVRARFANAGQFCLAVDYCLVEGAVYDEFKKEVVKAVEKFYPDGGRGDRFGRLVAEEDVSRVQGLLKRTDGTMLIGGDTHLADRFVAPTVVEVKRGDALLEGELFSPVLPLLKVDDVQQAVGYINNGDSPLALYLYSTNKSVTDTVITQTRSGSVGVNDAVFQVAGPGTFLGGVGESGMGAYGMEKGFETFSHYRPVLYSTPTLAKCLEFMQPHQMVGPDGHMDPKFERLIRLFRNIAPKGDANTTPVNERFLGGVRTFFGLVAASLAFFMRRGPREKRE